MDEEEDLRGGGRKRDRPDSTFRGRGGGSGPNRRDQENRPEYEVPRGGYFFLHDDRDGGFGMKRQRTWGTEATSRSRVDIADKWTHDKFEDDAREDNDARRSDASGSRRGEIRFARGGTEAAEEGGLSSSRRGRSDRDDSNDEEEEQHTARRFAERESRDNSDEDDDGDEDRDESRNNNNASDNRDEDGHTVETSAPKDSEEASSSLLDEMV